jgi:hypothetical protein
MINDLTGAFLLRGPVGLALEKALHAAIGFVEAHGLAHRRAAVARKLSHGVDRPRGARTSVMRVDMRTAQAGSPSAAHDNILMQQSRRAVLDRAGRQHRACGSVRAPAQFGKGPLDGK